MTKLKALTRKQLRAFIAILVAVCVVVPSAIGLIHARSESIKSTSYTTVKKENPYLETNKAVADGPDNNNDGRPDYYDITLESYLSQPTTIGSDDKTDTVLVLERSKDMDTTLFTRENRYNLGTYMDFGDPISLSSVTNHDLYDGSDVVGTNAYRQRKYIKDPNNESIYVYLAQEFHSTSESYGVFPYTLNHYTYTVMDSQGNIYKSKEYKQPVLGTALDKILSWFNWDLDDFLNAIGIDTFKDIEFTYQVGDDGKSAAEKGIVPTFTRSEFYVRETNDTAALNTTLFSDYLQYGNLWIKNDAGEFIPVTITRQYEGTNCISYTYTATEKNGKKYTAVYGAPAVTVKGTTVLNADYAVFQGFKTYNADGTLDTKNSLLHKSLYSNRNDTNSQNVSRLTALKESVEDFILQVYQNTTNSELPDSYQRIGIVSYCDKDETEINYKLTDVKSEEQAYKMITTVYNFEADGRRRIDTGLEKALDCLQDPSVQPNGGKINVVTFTAGNPSYKENNNDFEMIIADNALSRKQRIQNAYSNAKFYSIGLYEGADSNELHGDSFRRLSHPAIPCDGSEGSFWGGTLFAGWNNPDMSPADAAATNRFLNYLSSNYKDSFSTNVYGPLNINPFSSEFRGRYYGVLGIGNKEGFNTGITGEEYIMPSWIKYGASTGGEGYNIKTATPEGAWSNDGYYIAATTGTELEEAFDTIAEAIELPLSELHDKTELRDYVSDYFTIDSILDAYIENKDGTRDSTTVTTEPDGNNGIIASGLDFSEYSWDKANGKKMVVKLRVNTIAGFLGGNGVPTNTGESGIYDEKDTLVENFNVPRKDIATISNVNVNNLAVYLTQIEDLWNLFDVDGDSLDGLRNDFVDVKYVVSKVSGSEDEEVLEEVFSYSVDSGIVWTDEEDGEFNISGEDKVKRYFQENSDTKYAVQCVVTPSTSGTAVEKIARSEEDATVYVFRPVINLQDTEKTYSQVQQGVDLNENITNKDNVSWVNETAPEGLLPTATEDQPVPTVSFKFYEKDANLATATPIINPVQLATTTDYQTVATVTGTDYKYETDLDYYVMSDSYVNDGGDPYVRTSQYTVNDTSETRDPNLVPVTVIYYDDKGEEKTDYVKYTDAEGVEHWAYETTVRSTELTIPARSTTNGVIYKNFGKNRELEEDDTEKTVERTKGVFTVYVGTPFKLHIIKNFAGDMTIPEGVIFTITDSNSTVGTESINTFERLSGETVVANDVELRTGVSYTIKETFDTTGLTEEQIEQYLADKDNQYVTAYDLNEMPSTPTGHVTVQTGESFTLNLTDAQLASLKTNDGTNDIITLYVKNTDLTPVPPITGVSENANHFNPYFIAAAIVALLGGSGTAYMVKRKRDSEA